MPAYTAIFVKAPLSIGGLPIPHLINPKTAMETLPGFGAVTDAFLSLSIKATDSVPEAPLVASLDWADRARVDEKAHYEWAEQFAVFSVAEGYVALFPESIWLKEGIALLADRFQPLAIGEVAWPEGTTFKLGPLGREDRPPYVDYSRDFLELIGESARFGLGADHLKPEWYAEVGYDKEGCRYWCRIQSVLDPDEFILTGEYYEEPIRPCSVASAILSAMVLADSLELKLPELARLSWASLCRRAVDVRAEQMQTEGSDS